MAIGGLGAALLVLFLLAYLFLLRPIKNQALAAFKQLPERAAAQMSITHRPFKMLPAGLPPSRT